MIAPHLTEDELFRTLQAIEKALPEHAISPRIALSSVIAELARLQHNVDELTEELARRPRVVLCANNEAVSEPADPREVGMVDRVLARLQLVKPEGA